MNTTLQPIPELDYRSADQKEQIHNWLAELGIRETIKKLHDEWGIDVTYNKLQRYRKRLREKEQLAEHLEHEITMPEYLNLSERPPCTLRPGRFGTHPETRLRTRAPTKNLRLNSLYPPSAS